MLETEIFKHSMAMIFSLLQISVIAICGAAVKTFFDVRKHKNDLRAAFTKVRALESALDVLHPGWRTIAPTASPECSRDDSA